jgi:hypothetical protein
MTTQRPRASELAALPVEAAERAAVSIDAILIRQEYIDLPAHLAWWNAKLAAAMEEDMRAKLTLETWEARLRIEWRERLHADPTVSKPTESMIGERVAVDDRYVAVRMEYIDAECVKARAKGVVDAIQAKRDMLTSLGAHIREELRSNPSIREHARGDASTTARFGDDR